MTMSAQGIGRGGSAVRLVDARRGPRWGRGILSVKLGRGRRKCKSKKYVNVHVWCARRARANAQKI